MSNPTRTCEDCGADITSLHWRAKRCSRCGRVKPVQTFTCVECGASFSGTTAKATYCSTSCQGKAGHRRRNPGVPKNDDRTCSVCGVGIANRGPRAIRCGECQAEAAREKRRKNTRIERICLRCGKPFVAKRVDAMCCSGNCTVSRLNAKHNAVRRVVRQPRPCPSCETEFTPRRSDQIACSQRCYQRATRIHVPIWHDKTCKECGNPFRSKRSDALYCSHQCGRRTWYLANREAVLISVSEWRAANVDRCRMYATQYKARRRGWEGDGPGISLADWTRTLNRFDRRCAYCGDRPSDLHMEHVVPLSRGGQHSIGNVLPACPPCNLSKNAKLLVEWRR